MDWFDKEMKELDNSLDRGEISLAEYNFFQKDILLDDLEEKDFFVNNLKEVFSL